MIAMPTEGGPKIRKLKRTEYDRLVALGVFAGERIELLWGNLIEMSPQYPRHSGTIRRLNAILVPLFESTGRAQVRIQLPFAASDESEPEPDVAVVPNGDDLLEHPTQGYLVVEVSESTLKTDRAKATLYALSGVPEYWIVNLEAKQIEVHSDIHSGAYTRATPYKMGETITLIAFSDVTLQVSRLFT